jgi:cation transport protein ChaC
MIDLRLRALLPRLSSGDLWIFGYGSLMWNPGFRFREQRPARVHGYHRALCIDSTAHRGTLEQPGLVVGLAPGGSCRGTAFLVAARNVPSILDALWEREMCDGTYLARSIFIRAGRRRVLALAFVVNRAHRFYAGPLPADVVARRIVACAGERGTNIDYLMNTIAHLGALGVRDKHLSDVLDAVRMLAPCAAEDAASLASTEVGRKKPRAQRSIGQRQQGLQPGLGGDAA